MMPWPDVVAVAHFDDVVGQRAPELAQRRIDEIRAIVLTH